MDMEPTTIQLKIWSKVLLWISEVFQVMYNGYFLEVIMTGLAVPKFYNGDTQFPIQTNATVQHLYVDETGGKVMPNIESKFKATHSKESNRASKLNT